MKVLKLFMATHKRVSTYNNTDQLIQRGYFPDNSPCFSMDKDVNRETTSLHQLVCGVVS